MISWCKWEHRAFSPNPDRRTGILRPVLLPNSLFHKFYSFFPVRVAVQSQIGGRVA